MEGLRFNTAIAKLIELNNHLTQVAATAGGTAREVAEALVLMLAPLTPHVAEELWARLGHDTSLAYEPFPAADPALLVEDTVELPVQINGKVRGPRERGGGSRRRRPSRPPRWPTSRCRPRSTGPAPKKVIVVPGRMVSIVV